MRRMVPRRILPDRVLGSRLMVISPERGDGADHLAHPLNAFGLDGAAVAGDAGLEHDKAERHLALDRVLDAEHGTFGDIGVEASTSSIAPVDSRWPATLMMSSAAP